MRKANAEFGKFLKGWNILDIVIPGAMAIMFTPTFHRLAALGWKSADYTHAYFILPITLWLIWRRRAARAAGFFLCSS